MRSSRQHQMQADKIFEKEFRLFSMQVIYFGAHEYWVIDCNKLLRCLITEMILKCLQGVLHFILQKNYEHVNFLTVKIKYSMISITLTLF